ncbi:metallothionein [Myxococcus sp. K38C18041901]|uniref:metallothionein n=1 Tax=Myxococcus guangdongensis TaxID=2906760 RepID=UPI0020A702AE|nr:metallothionein [Myxococcus guangdongensis]MCP3060697.1 metallothionein [Myxococcus guangdongensis]
MTRNATMMVAALASGLLMLAPRAASACEAHAQAARAKSEQAQAPSADKAAEARPATSEQERPLDALDSLMAAKCQCGSKADCTCKKGTCECARCKPKRQVMDALRGQPAELKLDEARRTDASAGIFI